MNNIEIAVANRSAIVTNQPLPIVEGNVGFDSITATFDAEWDGLRIVATFANGCRTVSAEYAADMAIPWEVTEHHGNLEITFAGYTGDVEIVRTKAMAPLDIMRGGPRDGLEPQEATKDIIAQTLEAADTALAAAGTAEDAADHLDEMEGTAHSLPEGSAPTASIDRTSEPWKLDIGIPAAVGGQVRDVKVNGQSVLDSDGVASLEVDEELSELSANPVANAAVSQHFMNVAVNADETLVFWRGLVTV